MLSRVAERAYWIGRYLERVENLARLCNVFDKLFLDLPRSTGVGWADVLSTVSDVEPPKYAEGVDPDQAAIEYLLVDPENPGSLISLMGAVRENARTTRDVLPAEAWLTINRLALGTRERADELLNSSTRGRVLSDFVSSCQQVTGLLAGTMSHGAAYQCVRAGRNLERADMTTRIIDTGVNLLLSGSDEIVEYDSTLWMAVLRSVSGYQMYRKYVRRQLKSRDVIEFLMTDPEFPRSFAHATAELAATLRLLPRNSSLEAPMATLAVHTQPESLGSLQRAELHGFLDIIQRDIAATHDAIALNWFNPDLIK